MGWYPPAHIPGLSAQGGYLHRVEDLGMDFGDYEDSDEEVSSAMHPPRCVPNPTAVAMPSPLTALAPPLVGSAR
jgi:hypothetical protein